MSQRGQEEAPIELLIAVTVLTFVLIIGFYAYNNACASQFEQKMKSSLSGFARALEQIYQGGMGTSYPLIVDFSPIGCMSGEIDSVAMVQGAPEFCEARLGVEDCMMLAVRVREKKLSEETFLSEAVNIPWQTATVRYTNPASSIDCELSRLEAAIVTPSVDADSDWVKCGWKMQRYTFTLKKTQDGIDIVGSA